MTAITLIAMFALLMFVHLGTYIITTRVLRKANRQAVKPVIKMRCPYCTIEVTGERSLDLINHIMCIDRAKEEIDAVRAESKQIESVRDEYFIDCRGYSWMGYSTIPDKYRKAAMYDAGSARYVVAEAKVYRNGALFTTEYGQTKKSGEDFAERAIAIDKQRKKSCA